MTSVVTGAFGYIGRYIARHLLDAGEEVRTITTHVNRAGPFGNAVRVFPYDFDRPDELTAHLSGASTLYNTYWVRFNYGGMTFDRAVENTRTLFECARRAGIERIVHISVTHATDSTLPYYVGKARQESALEQCGVPFSIIRPTLVFAPEDILVNNIAWLIRRFPVFPIFGSGTYCVQPVHAADLARIAVESARATSGTCLDAIGPENFTFEQLVRLIASTIKPGEHLLHLPPGLGVSLGRLIGIAVRDVILTRDELEGLMANLLTSAQQPNGTTRFSEWIAENRMSVGTAYASELGRHFRGT